VTKRERYTERSRPHRKDLSEGGGESLASEGLNNPVVLIALGGLGLAAVLAFAVFVGRSMSTDDSATADAGETPDTAATAVLDEPTAEKIPGTGIYTPSAPITETTTMGNRGPFAAPEEQNLDGAANSYFARIETDKGTILAELWPELAPQTVNSFVFLARQGYFDGLKFHRVVPNFVIQGGDPEGTGSGGPGYSIPAEFSDVPHLPGALSMARTDDPNSAGSQFFIVLGPEPASNLDNQYAVFGFTVEGQDVVESIAVGDVMNSVTIEEKPKAESRVGPDDLRNGTVPTAPPAP
jgi:cyclophilin family peptidyl-prolyl cis-trans isomerase